MLYEVITHSGFLPAFRHVRISTFEHVSIQHLIQAWQSLIDQDFDIREDEGMMFNLRQADFIQHAHSELTQALNILNQSNATELAAFHLVQASAELIKINEHIDNESVLDDLFKPSPENRITSYNVCYTKLLRIILMAVCIAYNCIESEYFGPSRNNIFSMRKEIKNSF